MQTLIGIKVIFSSHGYLDDWSCPTVFLKKKFFLFINIKKIIIKIKRIFSNIGEYQDSKKKIFYADKFVIPNGISLDFFNQIQKKKKI